MTPLQRSIYEFVKQELERTGVSPTYADIAEAVVTGKGSAHRVVDQLCKDGYLERAAKRRRQSIRLGSRVPADREAESFTIAAKGWAAGAGYVLLDEETWRDIDAALTAQVARFYQNASRADLSDKARADAYQKQMRYSNARQRIASARGRSS